MESVLPLRIANSLGYTAIAKSASLRRQDGQFTKCPSPAKQISYRAICGHSRQILHKGQHQTVSVNAGTPAASTASPPRLSALDASRSLALARARHSRQAQPVFKDPYAEGLAEGGKYDGELPQAGTAHTAPDEVATAFLDRQLLTAVSLVNMDLRQEYRQVVLVGCGMDTRPFRLVWPPGTVLFMVAPAEVHAVAANSLKEQGAQVQRACLLRRVPADLVAGVSFQESLERSGFRGDRLSVWGLQGLSHLSLEAAALHSVFTDIVNLAAFGSIVLGELPPMQRAAAENLLAEYSLLGNVVDVQDAAADDHVQAAEDTDEDFFDNFS
ncbi:hypothetical protein WJX72_000343 [[Myrmecia] bisecta]|uniref:S-adenosyl-L-methionine-dependent methyltransferase n=1 Tax=[Myrmecia] bisecta TaxID=41462 RepID=A0AAW1QEI1_9CHLO